jgi:CTP:molybdopterin cytidylyltransferase MocA
VRPWRDRGGPIVDGVRDDPSRDPTIAAVVLAAGTSSRMREPKPLVTLGDRPLLASVLDGIRGSRVSEIVIVLGDSAERIRAAVPMEGAKVVHNPLFRDGMSSSLRAGIAALPDAAAAFFVVLADAPFVRSETYDAMIAARESSGARIVLPTYHGVRGNPALLDRSLAAEADSITGDRGCRQIHQRHPNETAELPVEDPGVLIDLDTPEEVELARAALREGRDLGTLVGQLSQEGRAGSSSSARPRMRGRAPIAEERGGSTEAERGVRGGRPQLVLVGDSPVTENLSSLGRLLGFRVVAVGPDLHADRFPDADELETDVDRLGAKLTRESYAVVATMAPYGVRALAALVRSRAAYIGLVASRSRAAQLREELGQEGVTAADFGRVRNPAGLDIRARTPEEIALSVAAEVVRTMRERLADGPGDTT